MGVVYRAEHPDHGEICAKVVRDDFKAHGSMLRRFRREAEAARRVEHEHVVAGFGLLEADGHQLVLQELVPGGDLEGWLSGSGGRLELGDALRIAREIALGLDAAHRAGLVHRDLKPGNVLLDAEGRAKITDFGLVLQIDGQPLDGKTILTKKGQVLGTPHYMAPEQWRGAHDVDGRVDLYALGVMLHQMVAGAMPFVGRNIQEVMTAHIAAAPIPLRNAAPAAPPQLEALVGWLLAKDPAQRRPGSAAELAAVLEKIAEAAGVTGRLGAEARTRMLPSDVARGEAPMPQAAPGSEPVANSLVDTLVDGKFEVIEEIGRGGMGVVYRARHRLLETEYAIKVLHPQLAQDDELRARFLREARALQSFVHEGAVVFREFGEHDGALYMAMDYVDGRSLDAVIRGDGPFDEARVVAIARQVLPCLAKAHAAGLVHRDLKPQNLIVDLDAEGNERVRILDFGIAKILHDVGTDAKALTGTGVQIGTLHYMSPEQAAGDPVDARTDIYAFAAVLYELLSARRPFDAETQRKLYYKINFERPEPLGDVVQGDLRIAAVVMRALSKEPSGRPASADELLAELDAAFGGPAAATPTAPEPKDLPPFVVGADDLVDEPGDGARPKRPRRNTRKGPLPSERKPKRAATSERRPGRRERREKRPAGSGPPPEQRVRTPRRAPASRSMWNPWTMLIGGVGCVAVLAIACCGGLFSLGVFGMNQVAAEIGAQLEDDPVLVSELGTILSMEPDMAATLGGPPNIYILGVLGEFGSGRLEVHATADGFGGYDVLGATLTTDDGRVIDLFDPPGGGFSGGK